MRRANGLRLAAVLLGGTLIAASCGSSGGGTAAGSESAISVAIGSEPTTLDPQLKEDGGERAINDNVYEALLGRRTDGELYPLLAAEMPKQADPTHWDVKLRPNIKFHNGDALDAALVAASFKRVIDPALKSELAPFLEGLKDAQATDAMTVRFTTNGPDPVLPARLYWIKVVPKGPSSATDFAAKPVGTGPYKFVEWRRGQEISLEANTAYWGDKKPTITKVKFKFVPEPGTRLSGLSAGEYDLITNLLPEDSARAPKSEHVAGLEHATLILNAREGVTADKRVREAMNLAVNKEEIVNKLYGGFAKVDNCQILSPNFFGANPSLKAYGYDLAKAKALIEEAGATGKTITIVGIAGRWLKDRELTEAVANYWTAAGLKVDIQILEIKKYIDALFAKENRASAIFVVSSNELLDASRQLATYYNPKGIGASNSDPQMGPILEKAEVETDLEQRKKLYNDATKLACDNAYFAFLVNIEDTYGMSKRLQWKPRLDAKLIVNEMSLSN